MRKIREEELPGRSFMFNKHRKSVSVPMALVLELIAGAFGVIPAYARAGKIDFPSEMPELISTV